MNLLYLAPYLPHKVNMYSPENKLGGRFKLPLNCRRFNDAGELVDSFYKPGLRPWGDLSKEIEHNGERFIPLERLSTEAREAHKIFGTLEGYTLLLAIDYQKLISWHFDIFNLIPTGNALDVNNL